MKDGVKYLVGKQIAAVIVARSSRPPHHQIFLVFPDGSRFEFYGENFTCCSGLDHADGIEEYVKAGGGQIVQVHGEPFESMALAKAPLTTGPRPLPPYHVGTPPSVVKAMGPFVAAWNLARAAIRKARRG